MNKVILTIYIIDKKHSNEDDNYYLMSILPGQQVEDHMNDDEILLFAIDIVDEEDSNKLKAIDVFDALENDFARSSGERFITTAVKHGANLASMLKDEHPECIHTIEGIEIDPKWYEKQEGEEWNELHNAIRFLNAIFGEENVTSLSWSLIGFGFEGFLQYFEAVEEMKVKAN